MPLGVDPDMRRRARIGLNQGESYHALKNAFRIGRQGEIRDRTTEGQHYRMAGQLHDFAAWIGLTPREISTGGRQRLGRITEMGQRDLRQRLILGATSVNRPQRSLPSRNAPT